MLLEWYEEGLGLLRLYWLARVSERGAGCGLALRLAAGDTARGTSPLAAPALVVGREVRLLNMSCFCPTYFCVVFCIWADVKAGWGASSRFTDPSL